MANPEMTIDIKLDMDEVEQLFVRQLIDAKEAVERKKMESPLEHTLSSVKAHQGHFEIGRTLVRYQWDYTIGKHRFMIEDDPTLEELHHIMKFIEDFENSDFVVTCG